jgi:hypothetical protein
MDFSHKHHAYMTITIVAVLFVVILALIIPAFKGYQLQRNFADVGMDPSSVLETIDSLETDIKVQQVRLEACEAGSSEREEELLLLTKEHATCMQEKKKLEDNTIRLRQSFEENLSHALSTYDDDLLLVEEELETLQGRYDNLEESYEAIIENAAQNLCCKYKVDYPSTDSYSIVNNRIVCSTGQNTPISCN